MIRIFVCYYEGTSNSHDNFSMGRSTCYSADEMRLSRRPFAIVALMVALLWSVGGNLFAAAFCPRFSNRVCCAKHSAHSAHAANSASPETSHHHDYGAAQSSSDMTSCAGHETSSEDVIADEEQQSTDSNDINSESNPKGSSVEGQLEDGLCIHCLTHSQPGPQRFSIAKADSDPKPEGAVLPIVKLPLALPSFAKTFTSYDHGPPGRFHRLFVLNSVFRI